MQQTDHVVNILYIAIIRIAFASLGLSVIIKAYWIDVEWLKLTDTIINAKTEVLFGIFV